MTSTRIPAPLPPAPGWSATWPRASHWLSSGVLFMAAALQNSASKATGLDGALRSLRQQPVGPWLLTAVALGIAAYGVYSFARAKSARV